MIKRKPQPHTEIPDLEVTCPLCGEPLGEDKTFCHKCGKYLGNIGKKYQPISDGKARIIKFIIGTVALIVFLFVYVFIVNK